MTLDNELAKHKLSKHAFPRTQLKYADINHLCIYGLIRGYSGYSVISNHSIQSFINRVAYWWLSIKHCMSIPLLNVHRGTVTDVMVDI